MGRLRKAIGALGPVGRGVWALVGVLGLGGLGAVWVAARDKAEEVLHRGHIKAIVGNYYAALQEGRPDEALARLTPAARAKAVAVALGAACEGRPQRDCLALANRSDPLVWYELEFGDVDVTGGRRHADVRPQRFAFRNARHGCFQLREGVWRLSREDGEWRVDVRGGRVGPAVEPCDPQTVARSWAGPSAHAGMVPSDAERQAADQLGYRLPDWAWGRLQLAQVTRATDTSHRSQSAGGTWSAASAVDGADATAWVSRGGSLPLDVPGTNEVWTERDPPSLTFRLGYPVRLMRLRFKNGPADGRPGPGYASYVEVETEERQGADRSVHLRLPARPNLLLFDCDLGVTSWVRLKVWRATRTPARSAALRLVELQAVPPAHGGPPAAVAPARPPADPVELEPDRPAQSYWFNDCRRPVPAG